MSRFVPGGLFRHRDFRNLWTAETISVFGSLKRSFINGTRLCPPAMNFPSPLVARSFAIASSSDAALLYSNAVEITIGLPG